jgi:hypothetical protein
MHTSDLPFGTYRRGDPGRSGTREGAELWFLSYAAESLSLILLLTFRRE